MEQNVLKSGNQHHCEEVVQIRSGSANKIGCIVKRGAKENCSVKYGVLACFLEKIRSDLLAMPCGIIALQHRIEVSHWKARTRRSLNKSSFSTEKSSGREPVPCTHSFRSARYKSM